MRPFAFSCILCLVVCVSPSTFGQTAALPKELSNAIQNAQSLIGQQKFVQAETVMKHATDKFPNKAAAWYFLGYARHAQQNYDSAMAAYEKAKKISGGNGASILYNMACIYAIQNNKELAFQHLDAAIKAGFSNIGHLQSDSDLTNLRSDPRFQQYQTKWLDDDDLFLEPTRIIHQWVGETAGDQFGWTARRAGDIDQDGLNDVIATAPTYNNNSGKVYIYSSKSGRLIHAVSGSPGDRMGNSAVGIGDIDGDKVPDFICGAPTAAGKGAAIVFSGSDATVLHHLKGETPGGQFGYEVSELGDIDRDGVSDFLVGEMVGVGNMKASGRVIAYSGKTGSELFAIAGEAANDGFGNAAAASTVKDGETLLAIGAQNAGPGNRGLVYVYTIKDVQPELKFKIKGDKNSVNLGQMFISFPGDLDRDGLPDVYASDFSDNTIAPGAGKVVVHSGATGEQLLAIHGQVAGEGLGTSPSDAGDVDGDGIGDLVIGAWQNAEAARSGGKVYLYSCGQHGKRLRSWTCKQAGDTLGFDACGIGDVDNDGHIDFLLTSAWSNAKGQKTGRVFIVAGEDFSQRGKNEKAVQLKAGKVSTLLDDIDAGTGGLNIDQQGRLYTADFGWRLDGGGKGGHLIHRVLQDGRCEVFCTKMKGASGNTFDANGNLYQSSIGGNFISKITPDGAVTEFCNAGLRSPVGLVFNRRGDLFACNCGNNTIQRISSDGKSEKFCDSPLLNCPNGITVGPDDMIYVCNFSNGDVVQITPQGHASKLATLPGKNNGHLIYHRGYLYVLARTDCRIYQIDLAGRTTVFAGNGKRGKDDGAALESSFSLPNSLIVSTDGKWLFVNETSPVSGDHRILGPTRIRKIEMLD